MKLDDIQKAAERIAGQHPGVTVNPAYLPEATGTQAEGYRQLRPMAEQAIYGNLANLGVQGVKFGVKNAPAAAGYALGQYNNFKTQALSTGVRFLTGNQLGADRVRFS